MKRRLDMHASSNIKHLILHCSMAKAGNRYVMHTASFWSEQADGLEQTL